MKWIFSIVYIYISYNTLKYAKTIWKDEKNKFAGTIVGILGAAVPVLGYLAFWR